MENIDKKVGVDYPGFAAKLDGKLIANAQNLKVLLDKAIVREFLGKKGLVIGYVSQRGVFNIFTSEEIRAHLSPL